MPIKIEQCVSEKLADPKFTAYFNKLRKEGKTKAKTAESLAWAICTASIKGNEESDVMNFSFSIKDFDSVKSTETDGGLLIQGIPVFSVGKHKGVEYNEDYVDTVIKNFNPEDDVPVQRDHDESTFATLGWVKNVYRQGKTMLADMLLSDDNAIARWKKRLMKKFSISLTPEKILREISAVGFPAVATARVHSDIDFSHHPQIRISSDGTKENTHMKVNGEEIPNMTSCMMSMNEFSDNVMCDYETSEDMGNGFVKREKHSLKPNMDMSDSELKDEIIETFSDWTQAYKNDLPDSAFALVKHPVKDKARDRALPYKNKDGKVDEAHVRNALARINQVKGFSAEDIAAARKKLIAAAKSIGIKVSENNSEVNDMGNETMKDAAELLKEFSEKEATFQKEKDDLVAKLNAKDAELVKMKEDIKKTKVDSEIAKLESGDKPKILPAQREEVKNFLLKQDEEGITKFVNILMAGSGVVKLGDSATTKSTKETDGSTKKTIEDYSEDELVRMADARAEKDKISFNDAMSKIGEELGTKVK